MECRVLYILVDGLQGDLYLDVLFLSVTSR